MGLRRCRFAAHQFATTMKGILRAVTLPYVALLVAMLAGMSFIGERNVLTATMLFLPIHGWILPAVVLLAVCLVWDRLLAVFVAVLIAWFVLGYLQPEYNDWLPRQKDDVTVVSCNLGTNRLQDLKPFIDREKPDLIAFQEVNNRRHEIAQAFPGYQMEGIDQFPLLSRRPIRDARVVEATGLRRREPRAARYELDYHGRRIAFYNVHMETPRELLASAYRHPGILILGQFSAWHGQSTASLNAGWENRVAQIDELVAILRQESLPMLVVGDFNMPRQGVNYPKLRRVLMDAFHVRGRRFGNTFPCDRSPPLSFLAPWSRLDYQFASPDWKICYFNLERGRKAQHCATAARYRLR